LGGLDRGGEDYKKLAETVRKNKINVIVFFPNAGEKMWQEIKTEFKNKDLPNHLFTESMQEAVEFCFKHTPKGKACLLSTAAPSFSIFKDYEDKANQFRQCISNL
jgi:UDP-N-acetylmuramoylalanine--D-glutamate ligase